MSKPRKRKLRKRYGYMAPLRSSDVDKDLHGAPWVERFRTGPEKDECLYEILEAALAARRIAKKHGAESSPAFKKAEGAINAIALGKVSSRDRRCKTATAALRKYVYAIGGGKAEADVLLP